MEHHGFPSDETLAAYLDGRLDPATRNDVAAHLTTCDECYAIVEAAAERNLLPPKRGRRPLRRLYLIAAITILAVAAVLTVVATRIQRHDPLAELAAHVEHRHIEGRISGFPYLRYEPPLRDATSNDVAGNSDNWDLFDYASPIGKLAKRDPTPQNLRALAVSHLVIGNYGPAVAAIELALTTETHEPEAAKALAKSKDAVLLSDAAAAYLARAKALRAPADSQRAVEAAQAAWKLAQTPEIAWNRALAIESQYVREDAVAAWNDYLRLDSKSPWAAEARGRLAKLKTPTDAQRWQQLEPRLGALAEDARVLDETVSRYAQQARLAVEESLLPAWGNAALAGNASVADEQLATARAVAASLQRVAGSTLDADAIRAIDSADAETRTKLAKGHASYGAARKFYDGHAFEPAAKNFRAAVSELAESPFAMAARLEEIACTLIHNDLAGAARAVAELETQAVSADRPLRGKMYWLHALAELELGHPDIAIELYRAAEAQFVGAHEDENAATAQILVADALESVGESDVALTTRMRALETISRTGATARRNATMGEAAYAAMSAGRNATAHVFLSPLINHRIASGGSMWRCTALLWSSSLRSADGDRDAALSEMQRARAACGAISDRLVRRRILANMTLVDTAAPSEHGETIRWVDEALGFFRETQNRLCIADLLDRRGRAHASAGDPRKAEADFREAIAVIESARDDIDDVEQRDAFIASAGRVFADLVDVLLGEQRYIEAFEIIERSRSGDVAHSHHGTRKPRPHSDWLRAQLAPDTVIVEYAMRNDSLFAWLVTRDSISVVRTNVGRAALARRVERAVQSRATADLEQLHALLVEPWAKNVAAGSTIIFVPDPVIERVPFSALLNRRSGRYLAEDYAAGVAPSALSFVASATVYRERSGDRALLVADPALDPAQYATLPPLDGARNEVSSVAKFYRAPQVLTGDAATKEAFLEQVSNASIVHFAGHALTNDAAPRYSALLLATASGGDGRLYVGDLTAETLAHVRIAVLSACSTARGSRERGGTVTLARGFLAAGVPSVVGTLWPVADDVAEAFSRTFHQSMQQGHMPAAALRDAQSAMLHSSREHLREPSAWGAFRLLGAATTLKEEQKCRHCVSSLQVSAR
jgi:CHAT domain-containing protein